MTYDIATMRTELQQLISHRYSDGPTGQSIGESFDRMRVSNNKLAERSATRCLIPQHDANGDILVECKNPAGNSHAIQEKVLQRIATNNGGRQEVLDFMPIDTARIADECKGPNGEMWHKKPWEIQRLPPKTVPITRASARRFACNLCDNATFRPIEDVTIPWPIWPTTAIVDDLKPDQTQSTFSVQLFLLTYRCLLQHISHFRGLIAADDYATNDQRIDDAYQTVLKARLPINQQILDKMTRLKTKYDRRLTRKGNLPMAHRIVPVEPAFPIASIAFTPAANGQIATTVYPAQIELQNGTTPLRHWMVISVESGKRWAVEPTIEALATEAQQTIQNNQSSIEWTVNRLTTKGSLSTYANPDAYTSFCAQHPSKAEQIERHLPDDIVVEYYERHVGKPLFALN